MKGLVALAVAIATTALVTIGSLSQGAREGDALAGTRKESIGLTLPAPGGTRPGGSEVVPAARIPVESEDDTPQSAGTITEPEPRPRQTSTPQEGVETGPPAMREVTIGPGDTLTELLSQRAGIGTGEALRAAQAVATEMNPARLRPGQVIAYATATGGDGAGPKLRRLSIRHDVDSRVIVTRTGDGRLRAEQRDIPHDRSLSVAEFEIRTSLYADAERADVPASVVTKVDRELSNRIDFQRDLRSGDRLTVTFERFRHPTSGTEHAGALLAASIRQEGGGLAVYRFRTPDGTTAYYTQEGVSVATTLRQTPVKGARLSSSFGKRDHPVLDYSRMHEGLDFAANRGTPIMAAGDGRVERASRYGSFGNYVRIRHNASLKTAYAHLARYADDLSAGDRVEQGQVIGYVGATGMATGPNLHYEVLRDGTPVNPRALQLPPRRQLTGDALDAFNDRVQDLNVAMGEATGMRLAKGDVNPRLGPEIEGR